MRKPISRSSRIIMMSLLFRGYGYGDYTKSWGSSFEFTYKLRELEGWLIRLRFLCLDIGFDSKVEASESVT